MTNWAKERHSEKTHICKDGNVEVTAVTTAERLKTKVSLIVRRATSAPLLHLLNFMICLKSQNY